MEQKKLEENDYKSMLHKAVVFIQNTKLAAALEAMDIPLRKDPPYTHRIEGGKHIVIWHFEVKSTCGKWQSTALAKAWKRDVEFLTDPKNRHHPFKRIMVAFKNLEVMSDFIINKEKDPKKSKPYRVFQLEDGMRYLVVDGTKKFKAAMDAGLKLI